MRLARFCFAVTAVAVGLIIPASASAQVNSVSVGKVTLDPGMTSLSVRLDVVCEPAWNIASASVFVNKIEKHGGLAIGSSTTVADYPGVPCTGSIQSFLATVTTNSSAFPLEGRKAVAGGGVNLYLADSPPPGVFETVPFGPENVKIKKK
jgi:hypothetical protein